MVDEPLWPGERVDAEGRVWPDTSYLDEARRLIDRVVTLSPEQVAEALDCARRHLDRVRERGLKSRADDSKDDPTRNARLGYAGQRAFCVWLGVPWTCSVDGFKNPDVGPYEIRTSGLPYLKVKGAETGAGADPDGQVIVFVHRLGKATFRIVGWMQAGEAKRHPEWKRDPGNRGMPAFWVPLSALRPMGELPR